MIGNVEMWLATPFIPDIFSSPVLTEEPWKEDRPMVKASVGRVGPIGRPVGQPDPRPTQFLLGLVVSRRCGRCIVHV